MLAPSGISAIRTDYKITADGASRRYLVLESACDKPRYAVLSPRPHSRRIGIQRVTKYTGLSEQDADRVLDLAHALSDINDVGSWPLGPTKVRAERVLDGSRLGELDYAAYPALARSYDVLNELLDGRVARIAIDVRSVGRSGRLRRHAWHFYYDHQGFQLSAHSSQNTGSVLNQWMFPQELNIQDAMERQVRGWGGQLGVAPDTMAATFLEVLKLEQFLGVTTVNLDS